MNARIATQDDEGRWSSFVAGNFLQSWQWGKMQTLLGHTMWRFIVEEDGQLLACALVIQRAMPLGRSWLYVPHGPVITDTNTQQVWNVLEEAVVATAKEERALFVRIDPLVEGEKKPAWLPDGWAKAEREVQPKHTFILDLTPSEDDLLAAMHSKTRYNIRLAERKGVTARFSTSLDDVDVFLRLANEVGSRSGFHYHPDNYYRAMVSALSPDAMLEIAVAEYKGTPLAAHIMVYDKDVATYVHGASSSQHRSLQAPTYLYWQTIARAKQKGMGRYDFFGIAPSNCTPAIRF